MKRYQFFSLRLILIITIVLLAGCGGGGSDSGPSVWFKTYGLYTWQDCGKSVIQTTDGGYFILSDSDLDTYPDGSDLRFIKTDESGEEINNGLSSRFGGGGNDYGASVQQTSDGGLIALGDFMVGSQRDMWLIKINSDFSDTEWDRFYGYSSNNEFAGEVQQTADGGYIIVGTTSNGSHANVFLVKTDGTGATQWYQQKGYDDYDEEGNSVQQTSDGGYIFTGRTNRFDKWWDLWIVKVDANGDTIWHNHYGRTDYWDEGTSIRQTTDGGYIAVGRAESSSSDILLLKVDSAGNQQWSKSIGGTGADWGRQVQVAIDGGFIIAGYTDSYGAGKRDGYIIKTDSTGNILWDQTYGGSEDDEFYSVYQTDDDGFIMTGYTKSYDDKIAGDVFLVKTDQDGSPLP